MCVARGVRLAIAVNLVALVAARGFAHTGEESSVLASDVVGPLFGFYSASFESALSDNLSIFGILTYENVASALAVRTFPKGDTESLAIRALAGANYYPGGTAPRGLFAGAWLMLGYGAVIDFGAALSSVDDTMSMTSALLFGAGAHAGFRGLFGPVAIAPRIGVGLQAAPRLVQGAVGDLGSINRFVEGGLVVMWGVDVGVTL